MDDDKLFDLYKISVEEYRFQVKYNWDRNRFYLFLTASTVSVAAGLLKIPNAQQLEYIITPLFLLGGIVAFIGFQTLRKGHEYYRRTVIKMSQLANKLQLDSEIIPISTTQGQKEAKFNLKDSEVFINRNFRLGTINYWLAFLFVISMAANGFGVLLIIFHTISKSY